MKININNKPTELPRMDMSVAEVLKWQNIPVEATAVALNSQIIRKEKWDTVRFTDGDSLVIISAAFGG